MLSTITVTSLDDNTTANGQVTLREALQAANNDSTVDGVTGSGADTIVFASSLTSGGPATLRLNGTELAITSVVTITGPGASLLTINGDSDSNGSGNSRVLRIASGATAEISGLKIANGSASVGAGIANYGTLNLSASTLTGNVATDGGGLFVAAAGTATVTECSLVGNTAWSRGGGVHSDGSLLMQRSTVSGNTAYTNGGGISGDPNVGGSENIRISNSTIANNSTGFGGGGIISWRHLELYNTTISGNVVTSGPSPGGGIEVEGGEVVLQNTILAGNTAPNGAPGNAKDVWINAAATPTSLGYNLVGIIDGSRGWVATDKTGTGSSPLLAQLGPLQNNGGPTQTMLPRANSPAIDAGSDFAPSNQWKFDEGSGVTVADSGLSHQAGTVVGATWSSSRPSSLPSGSSLQLDGVDDYVRVPNLDSNRFTVTAWVNRDQLGSQGGVVLGSIGDGGWGVGFEAGSQP